jgi:hypothetical protein
MRLKLSMRLQFTLVLSVRSPVHSGEVWYTFTLFDYVKVSEVDCSPSACTFPVVPTKQSTLRLLF